MIENDYFHNSTIRIFPNPVENSFTLKSLIAREIDKIEFYNLSGNLIYLDKIRELSNFHFVKNYDKSKVFN